MLHLFRGCGLALTNPAIRTSLPLSVPLAASLPRHTYATATPTAVDGDGDSEYFDTMLGKHEFLSIPEEEEKSFPEIQRSLEREAEYYMDHGLRGRFTEKIKVRLVSLLLPLSLSLALSLLLSLLSAVRDFFPSFII
jgi:hypothetical protein